MKIQSELNDLDKTNKVLPDININDVESTKELSDMVEAADKEGILPVPSSALKLKTPNFVENSIKHVN